MSDTIIITKTVRVLEHANHGTSTHEIFSREPDEPGDIPMVVHLERDAWVDLGRPSHITVTIEPGDLLNP